MKHASTRTPRVSKAKPLAFLLAVLLVFSTALLPALAVEPEPEPIVYMTKSISPEGLAAVYAALGRPATGKVAIKLHMGEPGGKNFLAPNL